MLDYGNLAGVLYLVFGICELCLQVFHVNDRGLSKTDVDNLIGVVLRPGSSMTQVMCEGKKKQ